MAVAEKGEARTFINAEDIARLQTLYRQGVLVPFIGAGMSRPVCRGWTDLIQNMLERLGQPISEKEKKALDPRKPDTSAVIRLAERAERVLRPLGQEVFLQTCTEALYPDNTSVVTPPQTAALVWAYWPLVLTTNYDDCYVQAVFEKHQSRGRARQAQVTRPFDPPELLGRSAEDCRKVLSSLELQLRPVIWALQGALAPRHEKLRDLYRDKTRELSEQIVLSHQQYTQAIHGNESFRRAFVEVFRRRSFLFLGSGLTEDYFVNLFSQSIFQLGRGAYTHFTLQKTTTELDEEFLLSQLNIKVIRYQDPDEDYSGHTQGLLQLSQSLTSNVMQKSLGSLTEMNFNLSQEPKRSLTISFGGLPEETGTSITAVSVGRAYGHILAGSMATKFVGAAASKTENWTALDAYTYRYNGRPNVWAIAARSEDERDPTSGGINTPPDRRNLSLVKDCVKGALNLASEKTDINEIHIGLLAAGKQRHWEPLFSFIQMVRGVGEVFRENPGKRYPDVFIYIVDPGLKSLVAANKVDFSELLSCTDIRFRAEALHADGRVDSITVTMSLDSEIGKVARLFGLTDGIDGWQVETVPLVHSLDKPRNLNRDVVKQKLGAFGLVPGSRLLFVQRETKSQ